MCHIFSSSDYSRRILTFPVVHPCLNISPTTLLSSLISLSYQINNFGSKHFVSSRKNAREIIRFVSNLLVVLEEICDNGSGLPDSINVCFFELHLTYQKILFLLEDCTRDGSRFWVLMKFKRISSEFRFLIETISMAIDVLPLNSIELSNEGREILELFMRQAKNAKFEDDPHDEKASVIVNWILNQFENKVVPNAIDFKQVLDYLEVRNWNQCNKEIKFLEEEINFEISSSESKEIDFLRNLMAFMIYSRVVIFDFIEENGTGSDFSNLGYGELISSLNPDDFLCPISLDFMTDPVTISTGHTFDRVSILNWFKSGNQICPKTREELTSTELVPNLALKKLVFQYCASNGIPLATEPVHKRNCEKNKRTRTKIEPTDDQSGAAEEAMKMVSEFLTFNLSTGTNSDKNKSVYEIRLLGKSKIFNFCSFFEESGTIPYLLNLLSSMSSSIQENSMGALSNLIKNKKNSKIKRLIVENCGLVLILDVLTEGLRIETRQIAATTLFHLSSIEEYRKLIGEIPEAIPGLVELIRDNSKIKRNGKDNAIIAILGLLCFPGNHKKVIEAGTVKLLIDLLNSNSNLNSEEFITESLAVLAILSEKQEGALTILRTSSSALHKLVELLESSSISSPEAKEYSVSVLLSLCINGGSEVVSVLQRSTSLMTSLYNLLTQGTSRATKKARSILRILHEFSESSSSSTPLMTPEFRFVHVQ